jgi:hypothetical protein
LVAIQTATDRSDVAGYALAADEFLAFIVGGGMSEDVLVGSGLTLA